MKPLKPINEEKLPTVHLLTMVRNPERGSRANSIVGVAMRGDEVLKRTVLHTGEEGMDVAFDEFCRLAMRFFYFGEGAQFIGEEE